jgi:hypothetical protein
MTVDKWKHRAREATRTAPGPLVAVALLVAAVSGCAQLSPDRAGAAAATRHSTPSGPTARETGPEPTPTDVGKAPAVADPVAPSAAPVVRNGKSPEPSVHASPAGFAGPVRYPDHVDVSVLKVTQGVTSGNGAGMRPGRPMTTLQIRFANRSTRPVDLNQVVVTAVYGAKRQLAAPVYDAATADFYGTARAGQSVTASYAFSIPTADLGDVTLSIDFDGLHAAAVFHGALR